MIIPKLEVAHVKIGIPIDSAFKMYNFVSYGFFELWPSKDRKKNAFKDFGENGPFSAFEWP